MYSRYSRREGTGSPTAEEIEIARYGLPPKYDGTRFARKEVSDAAPPRGREKEDVSREEDSDGIGTERAVARSDGDGGKIEKLLGGLGDRFGPEEAFILALILLLSGSGDGCEDASDVIILLALLLLTGR